MFHSDTFCEILEQQRVVRHPHCFRIRQSLPTYANISALLQEVGQKILTVSNTPGPVSV